MPSTYTGQPPLSFSSVAGSFMRNAPYVSPFYNAANTAAHFFNGTLFQHGPAPITSPVGRIISAFAGNPHNLPPNMRPNTVSPVSPPTPAGQVTPGQFNSVFGGSQNNPYAAPAALMAQNPSGGDWRTNAMAPPPSPLQQGLNSLGSYYQGTSGGYGGGSDLQQLSLLRGLGLDNTVSNNSIFGGYSAPWNLAQASGATAGGGINPALRFGGASPGFLVH